LVEHVQQNVSTPDLSQATQAELEYTTQHLVDVIQQAIAISTPWARPSPFANPDFTPECREAVKETRRLRRIHTTTHDPEDWERYKAARNRKKRTVKKALKSGHRRRVEEVTRDGPKGLWRLAKWARNRDQAYEQGVIPTLTLDNGQTASAAEDKARVFRELFFPEPPEADLSDIEGTRDIAIKLNVSIPHPSSACRH
jgi:hypothetical protein